MDLCYNNGNTELVEQPEIRAGGAFLDFGTGFYTTTSYEQAERWARRKMRRNNVQQGYVAFYELDFDKTKDELLICQYDTADEKWLDFVVKCRRGNEEIMREDLHIGPVADDNIYQTIRLFETGAYDAEYTVRKLKTKVLHDQWTFHTQKSLNYLKYMEYRKIK